MGEIHAARIEKSDRLQRVLQVLMAIDKPSSRQIQEIANVCAPSTCISELRKSGYLIDCERQGSIWFFRLLGRVTA